MIGQTFKTSGHFSTDIWKNPLGENWVLDFAFLENEPHMKFW